MDQNAIKEYIVSHRDEFLRDLAQLVAVDSRKGPAVEGKPYGEGPAKVLDLFLAIAEKYGFSAENWDYRVGVVTLGEPARRRLDILAHLDVVPAGDGWTKTEPFVMKEEDGKVYGRGTADDKGPALAALYAMRALRQMNLPLEGSVRLVVGCDEECGGSDMQYYYSKTDFAPMTFSPDADFPVINVEKGQFRGTVSAQVTEEEAAEIVEIHGGTAMNVVPAVCSAVLKGIGSKEAEAAVKDVERATETAISYRQDEAGRLLLTVTGKSAHASAPEGGNNAVTAMLALLSRLPLKNSVLREKIKALSEIFPHGDFCGKAAGIFMEDERSGRITVSLDLLNYAEGTLTASFDSRTPICATEENLSPLGEKVRARGLEFQYTRKEAHYVPEDSDFVQALLHSYEKVTGKEGYCIAIGGGTYVHNVPNGVAFGCSVAGVDNHLHGVDEFAEVDVLLDSSVIFADVIAELCGEKHK